MYHYTCKGTCSTSIDLEIRDGIITYCKINNGCRGNTQGVATLAVGRNAEEVAAMLEGIPCRGNTSCPDQLAQALLQYREQH
jgi:uncharacterized protein (TIGR03905 family)